MEHHRIVRVARHVDGANPGSDRLHLAGQLPPADPGHHHVGHQQMDGVGVALAERQGLRAVAGFHDRVARGLQALADELPQRPLVLDQEDGFRSSRNRGLDGRRFLRRSRLVGPREVDLEGRALPRLAVDEDVAAALLHDPVDSSQAQPRPLAGLLGREERLEGAGLDLA